MSKAVDPKVTTRSSRFSRPAVLGVFIGLMAAVLVVWLVRPRFGSVAGRPQSGPLLSECDGALDTIVIQYVLDADFVIPVYRQFLGRLPAAVTVKIMCPNELAYRSLLAEVGTVNCKLQPVFTGHPMTTWSRDRWLALTPAAPGERTVVLGPRSEAGNEVWPARAGDQRVAEDLGRSDPAQLASWKSDLYFDGGDFTTDGTVVFVTPAVPKQNLQITVQSRAELESMLAAELKRKIVMLEDAPEHHAGMFMMMAGDGTVLVGDPSAGKAEMGSAPLPTLPGGADFTAATQQKFDAVAAAVTAAGYHVVRIPTVPACDGKSYLTYVNVIIDRRAGSKVVYMPVYQGAEALNAAAAKIWAALGYEVRTIDCTTTYQRFGCLHCLVNVLSRKS